MKTTINFLCIAFVFGAVFACKGEKTGDNPESQVWTCSMHPQIRQDRAGKCPLCAMDLIPLKTAASSGEVPDSDAILFSKDAIALANIQTTKVSRSNPVKEIRLYGTIQPNQRLIHSQVSHVSGRIERLAVNFAGETIQKGQTIASIYSSDLLNAQQELLEAGKLQPAQPALLNAAREKLRLWKLTDAQIAAIEQSGKASPLMDIKAVESGIVTEKKVAQGDYVTAGSVLFETAGLSSVWAVFDAYEADLPYLKTGGKVEYTLQALPGKTFSGTIAFIDPLIDKTTRTAKIRVESANSGLQLKPEMVANARIQSAWKQAGDAVIIPKTAVLWTGKRSIVYVKQANSEMPAFRLREIELGPSLEDAYIVLSGLHEGEEIVTNGAFSLDAAAQLEGKPSMMNDDAHAVLTVQGACDMCKERIESAAKSLTGVAKAEWNQESKALHLNYNPQKTNLEAIGKALAKAGHDNELFKAPDKVYDALPGCCKYSRSNGVEIEHG